MPKGKEEEVPTEEKVEELETPKETPTEETLEGVKAEAERLKAEVSKLNIGLARKEGEVKRLREQQPTPPPPMSRAYEIMLDEMKARQTEFGEGNPRISQLEALLAEEKRKEDATKQRQAMEVYSQEWRTKLDTRIKEAGFDPDDEQFDDVNEAFDVAYAVDGKFERAEKKLDRILAKPREKGETEEEKFQKRLETEKREWMKEKGLLTTEEGGPSATSPDDEKIKEAYRENPNNPKAYEDYKALQRRLKGR